MNHYHISADEVSEPATLRKAFGKPVAHYGLAPWGVRMFQNKSRQSSFTVLYFKEVHTGLTYADAAKKFGEAVMHYEACGGSIDNRRD